MKLNEIFLHFSLNIIAFESRERKKRNLVFDEKIVEEEKAELKHKLVKEKSTKRWIHERESMRREIGRYNAKA